MEAVARVFADRGNSGAPVVDGAGTLLGMLTQGDLIRRLAAKEDAPKSWVLENPLRSASICLPLAFRSARVVYG
ncbi:MAG: CBS domain-containing protein [Roseomonas sp.]|nr:CBS domain-containing protein [Roseomonas sp.]